MNERLVCRSGLGDSGGQEGAAEEEKRGFGVLENGFGCH